MTGYQRMALPSGEVVSQHSLEMDEHVLPTAAVWWTIPRALLESAEVLKADLPGNLVIAQAEVGRRRDAAVHAGVGERAHLLDAVAY